MVTSERRRALSYGTDSLWDLSLVLQKEIHDLFTVTFHNSWAIGMCVHRHRLFISSISTTKPADLQLWRKKQSIRHKTMKTQNGELCLFVIMFGAFQSVLQTLLQNDINILSWTWGNKMFMRNKMDKR